MLQAREFTWNTVISMNLIRRAFALTVAAAMAALVTPAASACGGATTATGTPTNGLEKKSSADVLQAAAAALAAAKSVHVVGRGLILQHTDVRIQHGSATGTLTKAGHQVRVTIIGSAAYIKSNRAGLEMFGTPQPVRRHDAGRWLKVRAQDFTGFTIASLVSQLTAAHGPLEPTVRQATLFGKKVVVISWRDGTKLYVANTGPAYPLLAEFPKGPSPGLIVFTEYGARFHITAPSNAINLSRAGY
jgi:hypothetical protein